MACLKKPNDWPQLKERAKTGSEDGKRDRDRGKPDSTG